MKAPSIASIAVLLIFMAVGAAEPIEPVRVASLKLGGFWRQQAKRLTEHWLPHCIRQMEAGGQGEELLNLTATTEVLCGRATHWKYTGLPWSDAYVYNTVEAICLALAIDPEGDPTLSNAQADLRTKLEEWIPVILGAQAEDGYIHSFHVLNDHPRYRNVNWHEFYVMGYFLEMGVAHFRMTEGRDRRLYEAALKCADHLNATFGPPPKRTWKNGHAGLEYALCRLGRLVNEVEGLGQGDVYIQLALHFLDHQHESENPSAYNQSDRPAVTMSEAKGHAVRATYFYTAMADIARHPGSQDYPVAVDRIWSNAIHKKHYLTGGVGASHSGEAFAGAYELPHDGYCESCAGCGLSFWSDRMHRLHADAHYRDVQERVLYNNILGALELSGRNFFYQNPLDSDQARYPWHGCPCCVGNIPRALLAIKDLIYSINPSRDELYLSHFVDSDMQVLNLGGAKVRIRQETNYPWEGDVAITIHPERTAAFTLKIRIPERAESDLYSVSPDLTDQFTVRVNGRIQSPPLGNGYIALQRTWVEGDRVDLSLPLEVQRVRCDERVRANRGRVALQRGPLVYNVEDVDHSAPVATLQLTPDQPLKSRWREELLGGITSVEAPGIIAIPNFARLNRGGSSQVWLVEDPAKLDQSGNSPPENPPGFAAIQARTIDRVVLGDRRSETQHQLKGERTGSGRAFGHRWRHATGGGWFSYLMKTQPQGLHSLYCTYWGGDSGNRRFTISVDGHVVGRQILEANQSGSFFSVEYPIPSRLIQGKSEVTVTFQAETGATAGGIFDFRMIQTRPNVVLILADDLGAVDTALGGSSFHRTPNLERLAKRGMLFTNAYSASPLCSPTRASIMTGQSPARNGITAPQCHLPRVILRASAPTKTGANTRQIATQSATRLSPDHLTLAEALKEAGYTTAHLGKWHLGREPYSPLEHGFDVDIPHWPGPGPAGSFVAPWKFPSFKERFPREHIEDRLGDEAVAFMETHRDQPFFLNYWQFSVHAPFNAKAALIDAYRERVDPNHPQQSPTYAAMVHSLDDNVGKILDTIDRLELTERTVIIFYSDNGGNMYDLVDGTTATSNAPFRGGKATIYEGGVRVPAVFVWPGVVTGGTQSDALIQSEDLYATILEMSGLESRPAQAKDSLSVVPALRGQPGTRDAVYTFFPHGPAVPDFLPPSMAVRQGDWKLIRVFHDAPDQSHRYELYDLRSDVGERNNLTAMHPQRVRRLDALMEAFLDQTQAVRPLPNEDYDPTVVRAIDGWKSVGYVHPRKTGAGLQVRSFGADPMMIETARPVSLKPGRYTWEMRVRSLSATGRGRVMWKGGEEAFDPLRSVGFELVDDGLWHEFRLDLPITQAVDALRLQPAESHGVVHIEWIRVRDEIGKLLELL